MAETDIAVIGAGPTGRGIAGLAAALGLGVTLFERGPMAGEAPDPRIAQAALRAAANRCAAGTPVPDWPALRARLAAADADAAPEATPARFEGMGVAVVRAAARFAAPDTVAAGGREWRFRRALVATGSTPLVPALEGLETLPYRTADTIHALEERPSHLVVLGGEGVGLEMAQAFARLGARCTLVAPDGLAPGADPDLASGLARALRRDGVAVVERVAVARAERRATGLALRLADGREVEGSHLLLALGRVPHLTGLDLAAAGVAAAHPAVDSALRVAGNRRVWAAGGAAGRSGTGDLGVLARTMLFRLPGTPPAPTPLRAIRTEPALVEIGAPGEGDEILRWPLADTARGAAEGVEGLVTLRVDRRGRLTAAGLLAPGGLEMAGMLALAVGRPVSALAGAALPYPTLSAAIARAALEHRAPDLARPSVRWLAGIAKRLP
ncbi:dihydrolipoamide dehydrogenase [Roseomonas nepalensis]|uniref:Dihydrolipoamide dehydrogenase n=1 Tax=Muricoccus nepalensis TaxID=1854500 RepID=A0A502GDF2_9PROT|nr:FAD-dependent oxidoreductase [Roseomonas nepalensis]TPG59538.1 dihydrolipoamide dehydrogenase [Roseomonas nepalensis]